MCYGVSIPSFSTEVGRGGIWLPLCGLRCGDKPVTAIAHDETGGLLMAGTESGHVVLYQIFDKDSKIGSTDVLLKQRDKTMEYAESLAADFSSVKSIYDLSDRVQVDEAYNFTSIQEVFQAKLMVGISSLLVLGDFLTLFVGMHDGSILFCSDLKSPAFNKIENLAVTNASGAVRGLSFGYFYRQDTMLPSVYAVFESGHVVVIDISTMAAISYSCAVKALIPTQADDRVSAQNVDVMTLTTAQQRRVARPTLLSYLYSLARKKATNAAALEIRQPGSIECSAEAESASPKPARTTMFSVSSKGSTATSPLPSSTTPRNSAISPNPLNSTESTSSRLTNERGISFNVDDIPKLLSFVHGYQLFTFSLENFIPAIKKSGIFFSSVVKDFPGVTVKRISKKHMIISSQSLDFFEETPSDAKPHIAFIDESSVLRIVSLSSKNVVNRSQLLEGITDENARTHAALTLPNGSNFILQKGDIIYTSYISFHSRSLLYPLPDRANPTTSRVRKSLTLLHGREKAIEALKALVKRRKSAVINLSTAPTDLYKVFAKTRDERLKDDLFGESAAINSAVTSRRESVSEVDEAAVNSSRQVRSGTIMKNDMEQLKDSLVERGERINRLAMKMDDFRESAAHYRQTARATKEVLKARHARWGLF